VAEGIHCVALILCVDTPHSVIVIQRYFVLAESATCFCVLRIFSRAVATAWGSVAVGLRASIPIHAIESVDTVSNPAAKGIFDR
jgi:hypothetical protein